MICPSCQGTDTLSIEPVEQSALRKLVCSQCNRYLFIDSDTSMTIALRWAVQAWRYVEGKCATCPAEPMKARRSRCSICKEWITYTPVHPGHKNFILGRWHRTSFKPSDFAFMGHMNANAETHQGKPFRDAFYEPVRRDMDA